MKERKAKEPKDEISYIEPRSRPPVVWGITVKTTVGCGNLYLTVNTDDDGLCEMFALLGKAGGCSSGMLEGCMRLASLALRCGVSPHYVSRHLTGVRCPNPAWYEGRQILSCMDAVGYRLGQILSGDLPKTDIV